MYQIGELVVYGIHGVCNICATETRVIDRKTVEYFILSPIEKPDTQFLIPTQNQAALSKLRPLITPKQIQSALCHKVIKTECWISDENKRKQHYRELINRANIHELIPMIYTLHQHRNQQRELGRKFHLCDENFLRDAEKLILSEFSVVLGKPHDQIKVYLHTLFNE